MLPPPAWYKLGGPPQEGELQVNLEATPDGDRWAVTYNNEGNYLRPTDSPHALAHQAVPIQRLAVILDKTCPDLDAWCDAYALAMGNRLESTTVRPNDAVWEKEKAKKTAPVPYGEFNKCIRSALGKALSSLLEGKEVQIHGFWCADTVYGGLKAPKDVALDTQPVGELTDRPARGSHDMFTSCSYKPGLDLWDPVEKALEVALDRLHHHSDPGKAVLIVGNSPPTLSEDVNSPLWNVLRSGYSSTFRRLSNGWQDQLDRSRKLGIPVVYLFLTHPQEDAKIQDVRKEYHRSVDLSQKVIEALESTLLPVVTEEANPEGIYKGVEQALNKLSEAMGFRSQMEIRHDAI